MSKRKANMNFEKKRWRLLFTGMIIELCAGLPYSWSVFQNLLAEKYQWSTIGTAGAYSFASICMLVFSLLAAGPLMKRLGLRPFLFAGGVIYALGTLGCGMIRGDIWELYLFYGVCIGVGTAILYPTLTSYAVRLFPDHPGLASGVMVGGYGCGPFVIAPLLAAIYEMTGDISQAFLLLGGLFAVIILPLSISLCEPPLNWEIKKGGATHTSGTSHLSKQFTRKEMLKSGTFYLLYITFAIAVTSGTMLITQASPILQDNFNMEVAAAAGIVGGLSLSNTLGRLLWGGVSDRIGKSGSLLAVHALMLAGFFMLLTHQLALCVLALLLCIFCFGGASTLLAPSTAEYFGASTLKENYTVMFSIFSVAGIGGPMLLTNFGYRNAFLFGAAGAVLGLITAVLLHMKHPAPKQAAPGPIK